MLQSLALLLDPTEGVVTTGWPYVPVYVRQSPGIHLSSWQNHWYCSLVLAKVYELWNDPIGQASRRGFPVNSNIHKVNENFVEKTTTKYNVKITLTTCYFLRQLSLYKFKSTLPSTVLWQYYDIMKIALFGCIEAGCISPVDYFKRAGPQSLPTALLAFKNSHYLCRTPNQLNQSLWEWDPSVNFC